MKREELRYIYRPSLNYIKYEEIDREELIALLSNIKDNSSSHYNRSTKIYYKDIILTIDTESSNYDYEGGVVAVPYSWQVCIAGTVVIGRYIADIFKLLRTIAEYTGLNKDNRAIIWAYNLPYDFHIIKSYEEDWADGGSFKDLIKVISKATGYGIEFRDYQAYVGERVSLDSLEVKKYTTTIEGIKIEKTSIDHSIKRNSLTELTEEEYKYISMDTIKLASLVAEEIDDIGSIADLPLNITNQLTKRIKRSTNSKEYRASYRPLIKSLTLDKDVYETCKKALWGGYTYTNEALAGTTLNTPIECHDIISSYLHTMLVQPLPMSKGFKIIAPTDEDIEQLLQESYYEDGREFSTVSIITTYYTNLRLKENRPPAVKVSNIESDRRAADQDQGEEVVKRISHNGYLISTKAARITCSYLDYLTLEECYDYDEKYHEEATYFISNLLPEAYMKPVLDVFKIKVEQGKTTREGAAAKKQVVSAFGINAVDPVKDRYSYGLGGWQVIEGDIDRDLEKYNNSNSRITYYPWGVFIAARSRYNLLNLIIEAYDNDTTNYLTGDTDSGYFTNPEEFKPTIEEYNRGVIEELKQVIEIRQAQGWEGLSWEDVAPRDKEGNRQILGTFKLDGKYVRGKSLHSKTHLLERSPEDRKYKEGKYKLTLAGCPNTYALNYLIKLGDPFRYFRAGLTIPAAEAHKNTAQYLESGYWITEEREDKDGTKYIVKVDYKYDTVDTIDYQGHELSVELRSTVVILPTDFTIEED